MGNLFTKLSGKAAAATVRKALCASVVAAVATTGLAACASNQGTVRNSDGEIVVEFWHASSGDSGKLLENAVEQFNEANQGKYEIHAVYQGSYGDNFAKLAANIQTGITPGLMQASDVQTQYMKDSGLILPMQDALGADAQKVRDGLLPAVSNYYVTDDVLWSMPLLVSQPAVYMNPDMLEQAGVDPESLQTFDDYFDAADKVFEATGKPGLVFPSSSWWNEEFIAGLGLQLCTPDNGTKGQRATDLGFMTDEYYALWNRIKEGYDKGSIIDLGSGGGAGATEFTTGGVAIHLNSSGNLTNVQETGIPLTMGKFPAVSDQAGFIPGGNSLWILDEGKTPEQIEAATAFAKFVNSDAFQTRALPESGYLPTTESAAEINNNDPELPEQQRQLLTNLMENPVSVATAGCHIGSLSQIRTELENAVGAIARGGDPKTEIEDVKPSIDLLINRYQVRADAMDRN